MTSVPTFTATIYVGLLDRTTGQQVTEELGFLTCQKFCDEVGLCVSVTRTAFVYTDGGEQGLAVGLINYPRFPSSGFELREKALELAEKLRVAMKQERVSVVFPDETVMLP